MSIAMNESPIFVVGTPRSGTTLLAAMIAAHSRLCCGPETDFFHFLSQVNIPDLIDSASWPSRPVNFLFSMIQAKWKAPVPVNYGLTGENIASFLLKKRPSVPVILAAVLEPYAKKLGKRRWVEKTPRHILYLTSIRKYFPKALVIRIIRDPRDVALSIVKTPWKWAPRTLPGALVMWRDCDDCSKNFFNNDGYAYTIRYEDFVQKPETELKKLCDFIGVRYEPNMLNTVISYSSVNKINEPWKAKVQQSLDPTRIGVWQRELGEEQILEAACLLGDRFRNYGYTIGATFDYFASLYPPDMFLKYPELLRWLVKRRVRLWPLHEGEKPDIRIYVGNPSTDNWFKGDKMSRVVGTLRIGYEILKTKHTEKAIQWVIGDEHVRNHGYCSRLISFFLESTAHKVIVSKSVQRYIEWRHNFKNNPRLGVFNQPLRD